MFLAQGAMVQGSEWLLVKQEELGLIPARTKCFFSPRVKGGRNKKDPDMITCVILRIHVDKNNNIIPSHAIQQRTSVSARYGSKKSYVFNIMPQLVAINQEASGNLKTKTPPQNGQVIINDWCRLLVYISLTLAT